MPPPARPAILGGMEQEREDYDGNTPTPGLTTGGEVIFWLLLAVAGVVVICGLFALALLTLPPGPDN